jgi:DNA-binding NarL/FixJ family response regulator
MTSGKLTPREAEIARFVATGLSNKQIARKASISEATVKIHLHSAYKKLGIANRSTLAVMVSSGAWEHWRSVGAEPPQSGLGAR